LEDAVFLFNSEPGFLILHGIENSFSIVSEVGVGWLLGLEVLVGPDVALAHDDESLASSERVSDIVNWLEMDF
jgi:hypothetical protein